MSGFAIWKPYSKPKCCLAIQLSELWNTLLVPESMGQTCPGGLRSNAVQTLLCAASGPHGGTLLLEAVWGPGLQSTRWSAQTEIYCNHCQSHPPFSSGRMVLWQLTCCCLKCCCLWWVRRHASTKNPKLSASTPLAANCTGERSSSWFIYSSVPFIFVISEKAVKRNVENNLK